MLLTALLLTPAALTQPPPPPPPRLVPPFLKQAVELGLSEEQKSQLKAILEGHRASMEAKTEADREAHKALMDAVHEGTGDVAALNQTAGNTQLVLFQEAQQINAACLKVLTAGQRELSKSLRPPRPEPPSRREGNERERPNRSSDFD